MKLVVISDTHEKEEFVTLPDGDILIHCGDFTNRGSAAAMEKFLGWFSSQKHKWKIFISGNHEIGLDGGAAREYKRDLIRQYETESLIYLENSSTTIDGIKFYGSPHTPLFHGWAWNVERGKEIAKKWRLIPDDTNVLITHGPPFGILDEAPSGINAFERVGCQDLLERLMTLKQLKAHLFGHIHHSSNIQKIANTFFVNAAICTEHYAPTNEPRVIDIDT